MAARSRIQWKRLTRLDSPLEYIVACRTDDGAGGSWEIGRLKPPGQRATYHPKRLNAAGDEIEWGGSHHTIAAARMVVETYIRIERAAA